MQSEARSECLEWIYYSGGEVQPDEEELLDFMKSSIAIR